MTSSTKRMYITYANKMCSPFAFSVTFKLGTHYSRPRAVFTNVSKYDTRVHGPWEPRPVHTGSVYRALVSGLAKIPALPYFLSFCHFNASRFLLLVLFLIMVALCNRADHYIFILFRLLSSFFFLLFFPRLISAVEDWMSTILRHMVWS